MSAPHVEVVPRIIDTSIAATYASPLTAKSTAPESTVFQSNDTKPPALMAALPPVTFTQRFFSTIKDYIVPIMFVISVIVVIYVVWTYWTIHRNQMITVQPTPESNPPQQGLLGGAPGLAEPEPMSEPEDLSKYLVATSASDEGTQYVQSKLVSIQEVSSDSSCDESEESEELENEESEEESEDELEEGSEDEHDMPLLESITDADAPIFEPNFAAISELINQPFDEDPRFDIYSEPTFGQQSEADEEDVIEVNPPKTIGKRSRKSKRVTV